MEDRKKQSVSDLAKHFLNLKTVITILPLVFLSISLWAFLRARESELSLEFSSPELTIVDNNNSVSLFLSEILNLFPQYLFLMISGVASTLIKCDQSLSFPVAIGQGTDLLNGTNRSIDFLTSQAQLTAAGVTSMFLNPTENYIFSNIYRSGIEGGAQVISVDDPENPKNLWGQLPDSLIGLKNILGLMSNELIFIDASVTTLSVADMSNPVAPIILRRQIFWKGLNYFTDYNRVVLNPNTPSVSILYSRNNYGLILIYNLSNVSNVIASIPLSYNGNSFVYSPDGTVIVATMTTNIAVFNANSQNLSDWKLNNTIACNNPLRVVFTASNLLLVTYDDAVRGQGFYIYNMSQVNVRTWLSTFNTNSSINKMISTQNGLRVYAACNAGIFVIDIRNPKQPALIFNATTAMSQTYDLIFNQQESFLYAATNGAIKVFKIHDTILIPTATPPTLTPPTPLPLTDTPLTIMPPPPTLAPLPPSLAPAVLTLLPPTPSPTTAIPAPVVTLPAKPSAQPVPSGQTASPNIALHFNTTLNHKIEIVGTIVNRSITMFLQVASNIAVYMQGTAGLGSEYDPVSGALKMITRDESDANTRLATVRFSPRVNNTAAYNRTVVDMVVSQGSDHQAWGSAILSNFGSNRAPEIISNATLFFQAVNRAVELDSDFSVDFNQIVSDLDLDPLTITITSLSDDSLPFGMRLRNNILSCTCSWDGLKLFLALISDLYLSTQFTISIRCDDFPPTVINAIENIVARPGVNSVREITWGNIFKGAVREINAVLENGYPLPFGITLLNVAPGFSRLSVSMAGDGLFNVTVIATARFGKKANTTLLVSIYDYPPQITKNITHLYIANALMQTNINLAGVITDLDDAASTLTGELRLLPNNSLIPSIWGQLDTLSEIFSFTPPITMVNQTKSFSYKKGDPSGKYALFNFSVWVPIPDAPIINARIQNITGAPGTVTFVLPSNAFNSSYLAQLILTAEILGQPGITGLPDGYQWANQNNIAGGNSLTMTLPEGITRVRFNVTDPFNNIASQIAQANLSTSLAENIWLIVGLLSGAAGITAFAQYLQLFIGIINAIRLTWYSRPCRSKPFAYQEETYQIHGYNGVELTICYFEEKKLLKLNIFQILFAPVLFVVSAPFLFTTFKHAVEQFLTLSLLNSEPGWLCFDSKNKIFSIVPEFFDDNNKQRSIIIRIYKSNGILIDGFRVDPRQDSILTSDALGTAESGDLGESLLGAGLFSSTKRNSAHRDTSLIVDAGGSDYGNDDDNGSRYDYA